MGVLRYVCNDANAGSPYVIEYNSTACGYVPTYNLSWNLSKGTNFATMNIFVNGALAANSTTSNNGIVTVSLGDLVEITLNAGDSDYAIATISTSGFGNDPFGYYSACDLYNADAATPMGSNRITIIGNCSVNMSTYSDPFSCQ
jgi:hypothetical protein